MIQLDPLPVSYEQLRSLVLESLSSSNQLHVLCEIVAGLAVKHALTKEDIKPSPGIMARYNLTGFGMGEITLNPKDRSRVISIIWNLVVEGIVRPGQGDEHAWPFISVTEYGEQVLKGQKPNPFDPDGYRKRINTEVPHVDPVVITYLTESLRTFRIDCLLSSTVMLGCASEKVLLLLIEAYTDALPHGMQDKFRKNTEGKMMKRQFDEFRQMLESHLKAKLTSDQKEGLDVELNAMFDIIRNERNDAGHPTGKVIERERLYANLNVFPTYLKKAYELIDWLKTKPSL